METKEYAFKGTVMNGFVMLFVNLAVIMLAIVGIVNSIIKLDSTGGQQGGWLLGGCALLILGQSDHMVRQVCWYLRQDRILLDQPILWCQEGQPPCP